ncbi:Ig-like domain-containing protein [Flavobacterium sp. ACAM 123]|uniref:Ig-like domain-containing protein n=1 Tax=Flavobacterium sp. ACAM 123 TaxID=1189620 RepID=UPI0002DBA717|nr:Ig-like domain-containing protein [Flavobacterium sp. ACAM 123]
MLKNNLKYISLLLLVIIVSCAKRGTITGGLKDSIAPILKVSYPENYNTNFKEDEIKLIFDENVKLKNLNKQLVISPPMKYEPIISPTSATKTLSIKIKDTLLPDTTYSFNFGQSIADNNEGNPYNQFKYVFSTGDHIDSLALGGRVKDAYAIEAEPFISVMLYEVNDAFKDSIIFMENPRYITNTLDSLKTFRLENLKAGKYLLVALKDLNNNNKFDPKKEKVGFIKHFITIPNDTVYELELFKETPPFKAFKPIQASGNRLLMSYEGNMKSVDSRPKIVVKNNTTTIPTIITQFPKKDSLQIWYKPIKTDSLVLTVTKDKYLGKFTSKIKEQKKDTLNITALQNGTLNFRDRYTLETATPLVRFDNSKIKLTIKDSVTVAFTTEYNEFNQQLFFDFKKEPSENYSLTLLPGALTDFFDMSNDTLSYKFNTKNTADYGNLLVQLQNVKYFPVIVELTNKTGDIIASEYSENSTTIDFNLLEPKLFTLRLIYDKNKNKAYDTGNYLEKNYAEEVIYFSKDIDVRANWDVEQIFDLSIPYTPEPKNKLDKKN